MGETRNADLFYDKEPSRYDMLVHERRLAIEAAEQIEQLQEVIEVQEETMTASLEYAAQVEDAMWENVTTLRAIKAKGFQSPEWYTQEIFKEREKG